MAQVAELPSSKHEALSSNSSTAKKKVGLIFFFSGGAGDQTQGLYMLGKRTVTDAHAQTQNGFF
jgi:hypothetical protein